MARRNDQGFIGSQLLNRELVVDDCRYQEYRMNLEKALETAERREQQTVYVAAASFAIGLALMFVGGNRMLGDFDPWSKNANPMSIALGVIYVSACVIFPFALAIGFARFRPRVHALKEQLRDALLLDLRREVRELRDQIAVLSQRQGSNSKPDGSA